jgi:N-acetylmuramoyl-L-alanine amidase
MKILRHRLCDDEGTPLPFESTPNRGGSLQPEYLVLHYTAGRDAASSVRWFQNKDAQASAHVVIGKDGRITQMVPFDRVAWHAGISRWEDRVGLNAYSIGIELDNPGKLRCRGDAWYAWFEQAYDSASVIEAVHKDESEPAGWHVYTPRQIDAAFDLAFLLMKKYGLKDILGHEDIAPGRKTDPGPAFPMDSFRSRLLGRRAERPPVFETTTYLNVRNGPGIHHGTVSGSPLAPDTRLEILAHQGFWRFVDVLEAGSEPDVQGWVHGRYLRRLEGSAAEKPKESA